MFTNMSEQVPNDSNVVAIPEKQVSLVDQPVASTSHVTPVSQNTNKTMPDVRIFVNMQDMSSASNQPATPKKTRSEATARPKSKRQLMPEMPVDRYNFSHSFRNLRALMGGLDKEETSMVELAKAYKDILPFLHNSWKEVHGKKPKYRDALLKKTFQYFKLLHDFFPKVRTEACRECKRTVPNVYDTDDESELTSVSGSDNMSITSEDE